MWNEPELFQEGLLSTAALRLVKTCHSQVAEDNSSKHQKMPFAQRRLRSLSAGKCWICSKAGHQNWVWRNSHWKSGAPKLCENQNIFKPSEYQLWSCGAECAGARESRWKRLVVGAKSYLAWTRVLCFKWSSVLYAFLCQLSQIS